MYTYEYLTECENIHDAYNRLNDLADYIKDWDCEFASEICDYLNEFESICNDYSIFNNPLDSENELKARGVDLTNLPCAYYPIELNWNGIYTIDTGGFVVFPTQHGWNCEEYNPNVDYTRK